MKKLALLFSFLLLGSSCSSTQPAAPQPQPKTVASTSVQGRGYPFGDSGSGPFTGVTTPATSPDYGSQANPVKVGGGLERGSRNEQLYLKSLRGPNGEVIEYERRGSCCPFETKNSEFGSGLLDAYNITYPGLAKPLVLYIDMYDADTLYIPPGFTARK